MKLADVVTAYDTEVVDRSDPRYLALSPRDRQHANRGDTIAVIPARYRVLGITIHCPSCDHKHEFSNHVRQLGDPTFYLREVFASSCGAPARDTQRPTCGALIFGARFAGVLIALCLAGDEDVVARYLSAYCYPGASDAQALP